MTTVNDTPSPIPDLRDPETTAAPETAPVDETPSASAETSAAEVATASDAVPLDAIEESDAAPLHDVLDRELEELFADPATAGGQQLIALRGEFIVAAEKLFRRNLSPKSVSTLDEMKGLRACAVAFCIGAVERKE